MRSFRFFFLSLVALVVGADVVQWLMTSGAAHLVATLPSTHPITVLTCGNALQVLTGFATAPGAVITALTMGAGDSLQVQNCDLSKQVKLLNLWGQWQVAGYVQVRSPKLHDNVRGIQIRGTTTDPVPLMSFESSQRLVPQDVLIAGISGSAVGGQIESVGALVYYEDLPGVAGRFLKPDQVYQRAVSYESVETSLVFGVAGGYSGSVSLTAVQDLMKANTDYALVGYTTNLPSCVIGWKGPDTGNVRVGGPGNSLLRHVTADWFIRLSYAFDLPLVPIINSANKNATFIDGSQNQTGGTAIVNSMLIELAPSR